MSLVIQSDGSLDKFKALAALMDTAFHIPGTRIRFGVDSLLGLIPFVGDIVGTAIGSYIVKSAADFGVPRIVQRHMMLNLWIDFLIGLVPFAGDLLDVAWKANTRNVALMEQAMLDPVATKRSSYRTVIGLGLASIGILAAVVALGFWVSGLIRSQL